MNYAFAILDFSVVSRKILLVASFTIVGILNPLHYCFGQSAMASSAPSAQASGSASSERMREFVERQVDEVTEAIGRLDEFDISRDLFLPLMQLAFSAALGGLTALLVHRYQERNLERRHAEQEKATAAAARLQLDRDRVEIANGYILDAESAFASLAVIKRSYVDSFTQPLVGWDRVWAVRYIGDEYPTIRTDVSRLTFIVPDFSTAIDGPAAKWKQITKIRALFENYNLLISRWSLQQNLRREIEDVLMREVRDAVFYVPMEKIKKDVPVKLLSGYLFLTERLIKLTDDLLIELDDFIDSFGSHVVPLVDYPAVRPYVRVLTFAREPRIIALTNRVPLPDYDFLASELQMDIGEVRKMFRSVYDESPG